MSSRGNFNILERQKHVLVLEFISTRNSHNMASLFLFKFALLLFSLDQASKVFHYISNF